MAVNVSNMQTTLLSIVAAKQKISTNGLDAVEVWSKDTNLIFNPSKIKVMVISSRQMAQYHQLDSSNKVNIKCNNENIERVKE